MKETCLVETSRRQSKSKIALRMGLFIWEWNLQMKDVSGRDWVLKNTKARQIMYGQDGMNVGVHRRRRQKKVDRPEEEGLLSRCCWNCTEDIVIEGVYVMACHWRQTADRQQTDRGQKGRTAHQIVEAL
jgi:hypothetical protein